MPTQETKNPSVPRNPNPAAPAYRQRAGYTQAIVTLTDADTRQRRDYWLGELSAICRAVGVMSPKDSTDLHSLPLAISVGAESRRDNGETRSRHHSLRCGWARLRRDAIAAGEIAVVGY